MWSFSNRARVIGRDFHHDEPGLQWPKPRYAGGFFPEKHGNLYLARKLVKVSWWYGLPEQVWDSYGDTNEFTTSEETLFLKSGIDE